MIPVDVCVLLYGDHPDLATRVLKSLDGLFEDENANLIVAMNEPSARTLEVVNKLFGYPEVRPEFAGRITYHERTPQVRKYPIMRQVLRLPEIRKQGIFVWFDDDSYVDTHPSLMLRDVRRDVKENTVVGAADYTYNRLRDFQRDWVKKQWWYTEVPIPMQRVPLIPGSWWACHTSLLLKYDWPHPDIVHNGGDILFSLLCAQQNIRMVKSYKQVRINADNAGRNCKQPTRGGSKGPLAGDPLAKHEHPH